MDKKYNLVPLLPEEQTAFKDSFEKLLADQSLSFDVVPQFERIAIKTDDGKDKVGYIVNPSIIINKKVEVTEEGVVSPLSEEMTKNG